MLMVSEGPATKTSLPQVAILKEIWKEIQKSVRVLEQVRPQKQPCVILL